ncbi:MAG: hypothetical protein AB7O53_01530 [Thermoleophilia bacterium]
MEPPHLATPSARRSKRRILTAPAWRTAMVALRLDWREVIGITG